MTLALEHPVARLDKAPVSVELVKSIRRNVLAVPATALTATAGGGYAIKALEGARRVALAVTPGMFANGYVQVEGSGIHEGLTVIESEGAPRRDTVSQARGTQLRCSSCATWSRAIREACKRCVE